MSVREAAADSTYIGSTCLGQDEGQSLTRPIEVIELLHLCQCNAGFWQNVEALLAAIVIPRDTDHIYIVLTWPIGGIASMTESRVSPKNEFGDQFI